MGSATSAPGLQRRLAQAEQSLQRRLALELPGDRWRAPLEACLADVARLRARPAGLSAADADRLRDAAAAGGVLDVRHQIDRMLTTTASGLMRPRVLAEGRAPPAAARSLRRPQP